MSWKKRIGAVILVLLGGMTVLAIVCLVNAYRFPSRQLSVEPIEPAPLDARPAAERLAGALRLATISPENRDDFDPAPFLELHDYLEQQFPAVHESFEREVVGDYSLLYCWPGVDRRLDPILLMSHIDVVDVEPATREDWKHEPFSGDIADGFIWGRGALDIKNGALGLLEAAEQLLISGFLPQRTIYFALGHDEEIGGAHGNKQIAASLEERGVRLKYVLDEGGALLEGIVPGVAKPVAFVGVAEKGQVSVELTATETGGHSSMPPRQTAVGIVCAAVARLDENPMPARISPATGAMLDFLGPEMPLSRRVAVHNRWLLAPLVIQGFSVTPSGNAVLRTTGAATIFEGGVKENLLPKSTRAVVNFRTLPGDSMQDVLDYVKRTVDDRRVKIEFANAAGGWEASPVSSVDSESFEELRTTIHQVFDECLVAPGLLVGATDSRHYQPISDGIYRFIPARYQSSDLPRVHGVNERISVEGYLDIVRFFMLLIRNSAGR